MKRGDAKTMWKLRTKCWRRGETIIRLFWLSTSNIYSKSDPSDPEARSKTKNGRGTKYKEVANKGNMKGKSKYE